MAFSDREIEIIIRARDEAQRVLQQTERALGGLDRAAADAAGGMRTASTSMDRAAASARDLDRSSQSATNGGLKGMLGGLGALTAKAGLVVFGVTQVAGAAVGLGKTLLGTNASLEQTRIGLTTLLGSGDAAASMLANIQQMAAKTPFEFPELTQTTQRLLAFGFEADKVLPMIEDIGDAVAAMGGSSVEVDRVATALGQVQAKGKLSAEEMMQLTEVGIPAWEILADKLGVTTGELQDMVTKGAVPAGDAIAALTEGMGERFGGAMEAQSRTMSGMISTLKDTANMAMAGVMQPVFEVAERGLERVVALVSSEGFQSAVTRVANGIGSAISLIGDLAGRVGGLISGVMERLRPVVQDGVGPLSASLAGIGTTIADDVLPLVASFADRFKAAFQQTDAVLRPLMEGLLPQLSDAFSSIGSVLTDRVMPIVLDLVDLLGGLFVGTWMQLLPVIDQVIPSLVEVLTNVGAIIRDDLLPVVATLADDFGRLFGDVWLQITQAAQDLLPKIAGAFADLSTMLREDVMPALMGFWEQLGPALTGLVTMLVDTLLPRIMDVVTTVVAFVTDDLVPAVQTMWDTAQPILQLLVDFITQTVIPGLTSIATTLGEAFATINEELGPTLDAILGYVQTIFGGIAQFLTEHGETIKTVLGDAWGIIQTTIETVINVVRDVIVFVLRLIQGDWSGAWEALKQTGEDLWNGIKDVVIGAAHLIRDLLGPIWDEVSTKVSDVWNGIKDFLQGLGQTILDAVLWPFETARDGIVDALNAAGKAAAGALNGILGSFEGLQHGVANVLNTITDALGMGSPFELWTAPEIVFTPIGQNAAATGAATRAMATGGIITEPVIGLGMRSGDRYLLGEGGWPEAVVPLTPGMGAATLAGAANIPVGTARQLMESGQFAYGGVGDDVIGAITDIVGDVAGTVRDWVSRGAEAMVAWALEQVGGITLDLPAAFGDVTAALGRVTDWMKDWAGKLLDRMGEVLQRQDAAAAAAAAAAATTTGVVESLAGWLKPVPNGVFAQGSYGLFSHKSIPAVDWMAPRGSPIIAPRAGSVMFLGTNGWSGGTGRTGMIDHGGGWVTLYGHVSSFAPVGTSLAQGAWAGAVGAPEIDGGVGEGAHLHFEMFAGGARVRPEDYVPMAAGGTTAMRTLALVGERGPELALLPAGTTIVPNDETMRLLNAPAYADGGTVGDALAAASDMLTQATQLPGLSEEDADALKRAADAERAALEALQIAIDLLTAIQETVTTDIDTDAIAQGVTALKFVIEHVAVSLGDTAALIRSERPETFTEDLQAFAQAAGPAMDALGSALDLVSQLLDEAAPDVQAAGMMEQVTALKFLIEHIVISLGDTAALIAAERPEAFLTDLEAFAQVAGPAIAPLGEAIDLVAQLLDDAAPDLRAADLTAQITALKFTIEQIVLSLGDTAALIAQERPETFLPTLETFATLVGPALDALTGVLDLVTGLTEGGDLDPARVTLQGEALAESVRVLAVLLAEAAEAAVEQAPGIQADLTLFTETMAPALAELGTVTDAFDALAGLSALPKRTADRFAANIAVAAAALRAAIGSLTALRDDGTLEDFRSIIVDLAEAFGAAFSVFGTGGPSSSPVAKAAASTAAGTSAPSGSAPMAGGGGGGARPHVQVDVRIGDDVVAEHVAGTIARNVRWLGVG